MNSITSRAGSAFRNAVTSALLSRPIGRHLDAKNSDRPLRNVVVVTGMHRSGTTITGTLLNYAARTFVVHEPFNLDWGLDGVGQRYPYLGVADCDASGPLVLRRFLTSGEGEWKGHGKPLPATHRRPRELLYNVRVKRPFGHTAIVKDPFLLLALGWVARGLSDRPPIVTLRHPCAWVSSLQRRRMHPWTAVRAFREQDGFGDPVVEEILEREHWEEADLVRAGAATWAILVRMLEVQLDTGIDVEVLRMEDFSTDPRAALVRLFGRTGLTAPENLDALVEEYTGSQNVVVPEGRQLHVLRRNGAALATAWRTRMTEEEQAAVREIAGPYAKRWYSDW